MVDWEEEQPGSERREELELRVRVDDGDVLLEGVEEGDELREEGEVGGGGEVVLERKQGGEDVVYELVVARGGGERCGRERREERFLEHEVGEQGVRFPGGHGVDYGGGALEEGGPCFP